MMLRKKEKRANVEEELASTATTKQEAATIQVEASIKAVDDNIINEVIIDLTNTGVMNETPEVPNTTLANEVVHQDKEPVSKQSKTSK